MPLINITRKPTTLQAFQLLTPADMVTAATHLASRGYSATISTFKQNGTTTWQIVLTPDTGGGGAQTGVLNDWAVIENNAIATIVPAAKAPDLYQTTT